MTILLSILLAVAFGSALFFRKQAKDWREIALAGIKELENAQRLCRDSIAQTEVLLKELNRPSK